MILTSHQPNFLPYMGLFYKIYKSDVFVVSEDVQYSKSAMHNWNKIYTCDGVKKLTVPVKAHHTDRLIDIEIDNPKYNLSKVAKTLDIAYKKAPCYEEGMKIIKVIQEKAKQDRVGMVELNLAIILKALEEFGIERTVYRTTSDLCIQGHKDDRIFGMCLQAGARTYYSGTGARVYHNEENYNKLGIELVYSDYKEEEYKQMYEPFEPNLSFIDYIFNKGFVIPENWRK